MRERLRVFLVEDEVLLLMQLEAVLGEQGHVVAGSALSSEEAIGIAAGLEADLALVDVHLADGPTGLAVGRFIAERTGMAVAFMTATPGRIPADFAGAIGVIAKPYTQHGLRSALDYLESAIRDPPAPSEPPRSLALAPRFPSRQTGQPLKPGG